MDDRRLSWMCVFGSLASLAAICVFVSLVSPDDVRICDITAEMKGRLVKVSGTVRDLFHADGNVFFTLEESGCEVDVVLWSDIVSALAAKGINASMIENSSVSLWGPLGSYRGKLQVVPGRPDVEIS